MSKMMIFHRAGLCRRPDEVPSSERDMYCSAAPFNLFAARKHEKYFFYCSSGGETVVQDENTRHPLACGDSFIRINGHDGAIMRQENTVVLGSPCQNVGILGTGKTDILHAHNVKVG